MFGVLDAQVGDLDANVDMALDVPPTPSNGGATTTTLACVVRLTCAATTCEP